MAQFKTFFGKEISWFRNPRGAFQVKFTTGGELPMCLSGEFTHYNKMEDAIVMYLVDTMPKKVKDAKNTDKEAA